MFLSFSPPPSPASLSHSPPSPPPQACDKPRISTDRQLRTQAKQHSRRHQNQFWLLSVPEGQRHHKLPCRLPTEDDISVVPVPGLEIIIQTVAVGAVVLFTVPRLSARKVRHRSARKPNRRMAGCFRFNFFFSFVLFSAFFFLRFLFFCWSLFLLLLLFLFFFDFLFYASAVLSLFLLLVI